MNISPENPHYRALIGTLRDEGLGKEPTLNLIERAAILGVSPEKYTELMRDFPFLDEKEESNITDRIIAWYRLQEILKRISRGSSWGEPTK